MTSIALLVLLSILSVPSALTGLVQDAARGTPLSGATVLVLETDRGAVTDAEGRFRIEDLSPGTYTLQVRYLGYQTARRSVDHPVDGLLRVALTPDVLFSEELIVTATGGVTARYQAAQAFDSEFLQRSAAVGLGEMLDGAPGVAMRSFGPVPSRPVIRGLDGDRILVLENGERMGDLAETAADHAIGMDMLALDRVEIVRGPASLLYGSSAIGGVINLFNEDIPRSWEPGASGGLQVHGASVNRLAAGSTRLVLGSENLAGAARLSLRNAGSMRTPIGPLPGTFLRSHSGAIGVAHRTSSAHYGLSAANLGSTYGLPESIELTDDAVEIRMWRTNLSGYARLERQAFFESIELRAAAADYGHEEIEIEVVDGTAHEGIDLAFHQQTLSTSITARHRSAGIVSGGAVGINASARRIGVGGDESLTPDGRSVNIAAFGLEEILLTPALRFSLGARYEYHHLVVEPNARFPDAQGRRSASTLSGSAGFNLRPSDRLEIGWQLARAFRTPRIEELYSDAAHLGAGAYEIGDPELGNEVALGTDMFLTWRPAQAVVELSAFTNYIDDFVIYQPTGRIHQESGLPIITYEADAARFVGGEARLMTPVVGALALDLSVDYVRGTRRGSVEEPLPFIPPFRTRLALAYDTRPWYIGTTIRHAASQNRVASEEDPTPGYVIFGFEALRRLYGSDVHVIGLRLDNASNRLFRDHLSRIEERDAPMPGRNLTLTYRWHY
jgi:iron complex outermembrane recepter protein